MKLKQYLQEYDISAVAFQAMINVKSRNTVYRYIRGENRPDPEIMQRIIRVTDGAVQPNDFYDLPDPKPARKRKRAGQGARA